MEHNSREKIGAYLKNRVYRSRWRKLVTVLGCAVVFCTTYALILPAITMSREIYCGLEEHQHDESCYVTELQEPLAEMLCTEETLMLHKHTADCRDTDGKLGCGYADFVLHSHDALCYGADGSLICTLKEVEAHQHDASCYETKDVLVCEQEETGHVHGADCYGRNTGGVFNL